MAKVTVRSFAAESLASLWEAAKLPRRQLQEAIMQAGIIPQAVATSDLREGLVLGLKVLVRQPEWGLYGAWSTCI